MGTLSAWASGNVLPHCRRGRDLQYICCRLPLLFGQKPERTDATAGASCACLFHHLPAFEQCNDSSRRTFPAQSKAWSICAVVVSHTLSRRHISGRNDDRVAALDL